MASRADLEELNVLLQKAARNQEEDGVTIDYQEVLNMINHLSRNWNPMAPLEPYMLPITFTILALSFLRWHQQKGSGKVTNLTMWLHCFSFHNWGLPLISLCIAVAFTTWTFLPGSFTSVDLPDHDQFMRNLKTLPSNKDGKHEECMICWDNEHPLGELPCKHKSCVGCLKLMGEHFQTACPLCHKALFSIHDRKIFVLTKTSVTFAVVNCVLLLLGGIKNILKGSWWSAFTTIWVVLLNAFHFWFVRRQIQDAGEEWWRGTPTKQSMHLRWVAFNAALNAFNVCLTLYNLNDFFE